MFCRRLLLPLILLSLVALPVSAETETRYRVKRLVECRAQGSQLEALLMIDSFSKLTYGIGPDTTPGKQRLRLYWPDGHPVVASTDDFGPDPLTGRRVFYVSFGHENGIEPQFVRGGTGKLFELHLATAKGKSFLYISTECPPRRSYAWSQPAWCDIVLEVAPF